MKPSDPFFKRDMIKLLFMLATLFGFALIFVFNTPLSTPTLISIIITMLIAPFLKSIERRGYPRTPSLIALFVIIFGILGFVGVIATQTIVQDWHAFQSEFPVLLQKTMDRVQKLEMELKASHSFLEPIHPSQTLLRWSQETGQWFLTNGPQLMGELMSWILIVPLLSFFLLKDGRKIRKKFFDLVPNRFFERAFMMSTRVSDSISSYIRAKVIEGLLVGCLTAVGLWIIGFPYELLLGVIAGVTNIVPYLGPFIGAAPGLLICFFDPALAPLLFEVTLVYGIANLIDFVFIFPIVVGNLVQMHPLILIGVVVLGQQYYGLIGMLISIPIAAALKVVISEVHHIVYDPLRKHPKILP